MPGQSTRLANSKYRRGTILGLTVAEVFILLLFLLMLVFLVLSQEQIQQLNQQEQDLQRLESLEEFRDTWEDSLSGIETPDEIVALTRWRNSVGNTQGNVTEQLLAQLAQSEQERDAAEAELGKVVEENERLLDESSKQQEELGEQKNYIADLEQQNQHLSAQTEEQRILREKGQNPPCWYEAVAAANGGTREKALYLFDIAVFDQHMIVRQRPIPPGGAFDDSNRTYAEEAENLPLEEIRYGMPLTDSEMEEFLRPIYDAGKESRVRSYSCVFFVQVWDETSQFAKERWQQAHDRVLEGLFGTFTIRDEQWQSQ